MSEINLVSVTNEDVQSINVEISNFTNSVDIELGQNFSAALDFHNQDNTSHRYLLEKLAEKVDIEQGKGLSQNNLTDELKSTYDNYQNSISDIQSDISDIQEDLTSLGNSLPEIATENQAILGLDDTAMMTPLKVLKSIQNNSQTYLTESYQNGASWYRIYSDGWCEQGGSETSLATTYPNGITTYFLKPFTDTNYTIMMTVNSTSIGALSPVFLGINTKTATYFTTSNYSSTANVSSPKYWYACGYIN